jgi:hypothetical protein
LDLARNNSNHIAPVPITIALDQQAPRQLNCLMVLVSSLDKFFLRLRPYWGTEAGPLHYTALSAQPRYMLRSLPSLLRGRKGRHGTPENGYFSHNVHEVRLTLSSGFTLDGELYTPDELEPVVVQDGGQASFLQL